MDYLASHAAQSLDPERLANELDVTIEGVAPYLATIDESVVELEELFEPPTEEEVETFKRHILSNARTPEWTVVISRIDAGELTWREIASGEVDTDRDVDAAMRSTPRVDPSTLAGGEGERIGSGTSSAVPSDKIPARPTRESRFDDDDEYFEGFTPRG